MGLCLPRRRRAIWLASRPSTWSVPSTTYQSRVMSDGLAEKVFMACSNESKMRACSKVEHCTISFSFRSRKCDAWPYAPEADVRLKKGAILWGPRLEDSTIGGEWRNRSAV